MEDSLQNNRLSIVRAPEGNNFWRSIECLAIQIALGKEVISMQITIEVVR